MQISVNRALAELKLITKKIEQKTQKLVVAEVFKATSSNAELTEFKEKVSAEFNSVSALINNRNIIKCAIVASNAVTKVTVNNKTMTVAEAIERKTSIHFEKALSMNIREKYYNAKARTEKHNDKVDAAAEAQAAKILESDSAESKKDVVYMKVVENYKETNGALLVSVNGIEKIIEESQARIDGFETEVDHILNESNVKTMIDI